MWHTACRNAERICNKHRHVASIGRDGAVEVPVSVDELFSGSEILGRMAMGRMLGGLSSRRYPVGLEPVGEHVERAASATSKSAVSRRFVAMPRPPCPSCWPHRWVTWTWWR